MRQNAGSVMQFSRIKYETECLCIIAVVDIIFFVDRKAIIPRIKVAINCGRIHCI